MLKLVGKGPGHGGPAEPERADPAEDTGRNQRPSRPLSAAPGLSSRSAMESEP